MKSVVYAFPISHHFRKPFHELLRTRLRSAGIQYNYIYSCHDRDGRSDTVPISWGSEVPTLALPGTNLMYQCAIRSTWQPDLVILQQENALLSNHVIQFLRRARGRRVAFFGHGRNFQSLRANPYSELLKRRLLANVDWFFAYTESSSVAVQEAGFPAERITVFNNTIDTRSIEDERGRLLPHEQATLRKTIFGGSRNIAAYVGGLYDLKRLPFLLRSAVQIRAAIPDFHLIVIGSGPLQHLVQQAAGEFDWVHYLGPLFGQEKTRFVSLAKTLLMPGLVGLAIIDSFAYRVPLVTTHVPYHSPEYSYLNHGRNGWSVTSAEDPGAFAHAVVAILRDEALRDRLVKGCELSASIYTLENMVERFSNGVLGALSFPTERPH